MGLAYLPDGRRMDYEDYLKTPEWRNVKQNRLAFDNWECAICHKSLLDDSYETHHLNYAHLGHEDIKHDIISTCPTCHTDFHNGWTKVKYWEQSNPYSHWKEYNLESTAAICYENIGKDYMFGGDFNMCDQDTVCTFINDYFNRNGIAPDIRVSETDIALFFRNRRYDLLLAADKANEPLEEMLDRMFGPKGLKGGNRKRSAARSFFTKHKIPAIKRFYNENANVLLLMTEVSKIEKENSNE